MPAERRPRVHEISERRTPISYELSCTCGWRHSETLRQNAWARVAKLNSAVRRHRAAVEAEASAAAKET